MKRLILLLLILSFAGGCAHVVSEQLRKEADGEIPPRELFGNPDAYKGRIVILGGVIAGSTNTDKGTYIEVVQKPLDYRGRPKDTDVSYGRFLVLSDGYLDPAIYSRGKPVTVAGEVMGKTVRPLGEMQYPYTLIRAREIHLVERSRPLPIWFGIGVGATF
ncbi:MAG TPA: Slp family lipoprotein [Dissulfurispiraceae bacterium]